MNHEVHGSTGGASGGLAGAFVQRTSSKDEFNNPPRTQKFGHSHIVCRADAPNLGIGIDSFHAFATKTLLEDLDILDPDKIFLVQLADFMLNEIKSVEERIDTARHFRVFPGEGVHSEQLTELVMRLDRLGYRGDYSFEVFNDDYQRMPPPVVAERARRSAVWLGEDVLHRSVPLPGRMRLRRQAGEP